MTHENDNRFALMTYRYIRFAAAAAALLAVAGAAAADRPLVSPIFGDNLVLQSGKPNAIWGWSDPGDTVRNGIGEQSATADADADGRWLARIQPPPPGGPIR